MKGSRASSWPDKFVKLSRKRTSHHFMSTGVIEVSTFNYYQLFVTFYGAAQIEVEDEVWLSLIPYT